MALDVHCRIGSLEKNRDDVIKALEVHCRIGSLENSSQWGFLLLNVHCRIGSLEIKIEGFWLACPRSLPYRQLRNNTECKKF